MTRHLVLVLGDQLDRHGAAFDGFDGSRDRVWMAEVAEESTHVWTHKARIAVFLSAMRHFRSALEQEGIEIDSTELAAEPAVDEPGTLAAALLAVTAPYALGGRSYTVMSGSMEPRIQTGDAGSPSSTTPAMRQR